jgi:hypothetical protein
MKHNLHVTNVGTMYVTVHKQLEHYQAIQKVSVTKLLRVEG